MPPMYVCIYICIVIIIHMLMNLQVFTNAGLDDSTPTSHFLLKFLLSAICTVQLVTMTTVKLESLLIHSHVKSLIINPYQTVLGID